MPVCARVLCVSVCSCVLGVRVRACARRVRYCGVCVVRPHSTGLPHMPPHCVQLQVRRARAGRPVPLTLELIHVAVWDVDASAFSAKARSERL